MGQNLETLLTDFYILDEECVWAVCVRISLGLIQASMSECASIPYPILSFSGTFLTQITIFPQ